MEAPPEDIMKPYAVPDYREINLDSPSPLPLRYILKQIALPGALRAVAKPKEGSQVILQEREIGH